MQEALRKTNLRAIKQTFAMSSEEVFDWMTEVNMEFPLILKPAMGAGTEGVRKCNNAEDVIDAFEVECDKIWSTHFGIRRTSTDVHVRGSTYVDVSGRTWTSTSSHVDVRRRTSTYVDLR